MYFLTEREDGYWDLYSADIDSDFRRVVDAKEGNYLAKTLKTALVKRYINEKLTIVEMGAFEFM